MTTEEGTPTSAEVPETSTPAGEKPPTAVETGASGATQVLSFSDDNRKTEVSASTIGRMMGLALVTDLKLLESKLDLLSTKVTTFTVKLDKIQSTLQNVSTGSDMERIEMTLVSIRNMLKESMPASDKTVENETIDKAKLQKFMK